MELPLLVSCGWEESKWRLLILLLWVELLLLELLWGVLLLLLWLWIPWYKRPRHCVEFSRQR